MPEHVAEVHVTVHGCHCPSMEWDAIDDLRGGGGQVWLGAGDVTRRFDQLEVEGVAVKDGLGRQAARSLHLRWPQSGFGQGCAGPSSGWPTSP